MEIELWRSTRPYSVAGLILVLAGLLFFMPGGWVRSLLLLGVLFVACSDITGELLIAAITRHATSRAKLWRRTAILLRAVAFVSIVAALVIDWQAS